MNPFEGPAVAPRARQGAGEEVPDEEGVSTLEGIGEGVSVREPQGNSTSELVEVRGTLVPVLAEDHDDGERLWHCGH